MTSKASGVGAILVFMILAVLQLISLEVMMLGFILICMPSPTQIENAMVHAMRRHDRWN